MNENLIKASFKFDFIKEKEKIELWNIVSIDNEKQSGENFLAFLSLINKSKEKISKLFIIDTSYLNRHYSPSYSNKNQKTEWIKENEKYLKNLEVQYEVKSWYEILQTPQYKDINLKIVSDYHGDNEGKNLDEEFRKNLDDLAERYAAKKGGKLKAQKYLLEESSGAASLLSNICYPGKINPVIAYSIKKHNPKLQIIEYRLRGPGKKVYLEHQNKSYNPTIFNGVYSFTGQVQIQDNECFYNTLFNLSRVLKLNVLTPEQQAVFFMEFIKLGRKFQLPNADLEETNEEIERQKTASL